MVGHANANMVGIISSGIRDPSRYSIKTHPVFKQNQSIVKISQDSAVSILLMKPQLVKYKIIAINNCNSFHHSSSHAYKDSTEDNPNETKPTFPLYFSNVDTMQGDVNKHGRKQEKAPKSFDFGAFFVTLSTIDASSEAGPDIIIVLPQSSCR